MPKGKYVTIPEFALLVGVHKKNIYNLADSGKITTKLIGSRRMIDPVVSKKEYKDNVSPSAQKKGRQSAAKKLGKKIIPKKDKEPELPKGFITIAEAERQEKVYKAKLAQIKYKEQASLLVKADQVKRESFEMGRNTRDAIMNVPARISHELAAETSPHQLEIKLTKELAKALESVVSGS